MNSRTFQTVVFVFHPDALRTVATAALSSLILHPSSLIPHPSSFLDRHTFATSVRMPSRSRG